MRRLALAVQLRPWPPHFKAVNGIASYPPSPLSVRYFWARSGSVPGYDDGEGLNLELPLAQSAFSPVPTKKSMLIEGVEPAARRGKVQGNVRTPRFPALLPWPLPSNSGRSARGEPGTPSSASFAAARAPKPSSAIAILRPTRLGLAL
jgi:hypothetical protein